MANILWFRKTHECSTQSIDLSQKRRKYETLKYENFKINKINKKHTFANAIRNPHRIQKEIYCDSTNKPSASDVPGSWNLTVNDELRTASLVMFKIQRQIPHGGDSTWLYTQMRTT